MTMFAEERKIPLAFRPWLPLSRTTPVGPDGQLRTLESNETFWCNAHYLVHRYEFWSTEDDEHPSQLTMIWLSLRTVENDTRRDWREYQRIKNELCGPEWWGLEVYPAEASLVDGANQYHLWCFPEKPKMWLPTQQVTGDFGFSERLVSGTPLEPGARQRPLRDDRDVWSA